MPGPAPSRRSLLLCLHNHQPAGNFDSVIAAASRDAYLPFLGTLADFPSVKVTIHFSGFLLRWLEDRSPETFSLLKALSDRGQAEVLGGGMYEPILALLPERDRLGQIEALGTEVKRLFGKSPEHRSRSLRGIGSRGGQAVTSSPCPGGVLRTPPRPPRYGH